MNLLTQRPIPSTNGLVFHAPMDEGYLSGTAIQETTNTYVVAGTNTPVALYPGFDLVSGSSQRITVGAGPLSTFTFSMWVKIDDVAGNDPLHALNAGAYAIDVGGTLTPTYVAGSTVTYVNGVSGATLTSGVWHHYAVTNTITRNASAFIVGQIGAAYLDGTVSGVRLYSTLLSAEEIRSIYELERYIYQK